MIIDLLSIILWSYIVLVGMVVVGWNKKTKKSVNSYVGLVSVVVPFRNEESNLETTIESILKNGNAQFELILVDDHSEDNSLSICESYEAKFKNVTVLRLNTGTGKKAAIQLAIEHASSEIILQTDADCTVKKTWITSMKEQFHNQKILLIGPVKVIATNEKWNWFNQLEFGYLQTFTGAFANFDNPIMANGANMMYTKTIYWEYKQSKLGADYASGDDQFLLSHVKTHHSNAIQYVKNQDAIVSTIFPSKWEAMITQRVRWAKKNNNSTGIDIIIGFLLLSAQFLLPVCLILSMFNFKFIETFWTVFILKTGIELVLAFTFMKFFRINRLRYVPLFTIMYPYFLVKIMVQAKRDSNKWKGRKL
ncbi:MAG: biofilm PGA synthesis N-glycosyltransferase PgaC [Saprospiraceae bacterium]|jgi:biofilm PGA synthesis N-glycosyltransferase PgaC